MPKYRVFYRGEFCAEVEAPNIKEAVKRFKSGEVEYEVCGDLKDEYLEVGLIEL